MKKKMLSFLCLILSASLLCLVGFWPGAEVSATHAAKTSSVSEQERTFDPDRALAARFLNILNHNFVYDTCFDSTDRMIDASMAALLSYCEGENSDFVAEQAVTNYLYDMYGVTVTDFSGYAQDFPRQEGYVYVIPRGFTVYQHTSPSITVNPDGSYTVVTEVAVLSHDGEPEQAQAVSLFVKNPASSFGFSLIASDLSYFSTAI